MYSVYENKDKNLWCIIDDNMIVDELSYKYCLSLSKKAMSTVRIKMYSICHIYNFMYERRIKWNELVASHIADFKTWLKYRDDLISNSKAKIGEGSWNTYISYIGGFIEWLDLKNENMEIKIDRKLLNKKTTNSDNEPEITWRSNTAKESIDYLPEEERVLIKNELSKRDELIFDIMIDTGLRLGEMFSLTVDKFPINRSGEEIIPIKLSHTGDTNINRQLKTGTRTIFLHIDIYNKVCRYIEHTRSFRLDKKGYIFVTRKNSRFSKKGTALKPSGFRQNLNNVFKKLNLKDKKYRPHIFRHTFATDLYLVTKDIKLVQTLLGHKTLNTSQLYTHLSDEEIIEALKEVNQRIYKNTFKNIKS